jgi:hypothetical protein
MRREIQESAKVRGPCSECGGLALTTWKVCIAGLLPQCKRLNSPVAKFLVPDWRDIVDSGNGLSYCSARLHIGWRAGTTTLCQNQLYPPVRMLRIWPLEGMTGGAPANSVTDSPSPSGRYVFRGPCSNCGLRRSCPHHQEGMNWKAFFAPFRALPSLQKVLI